MRKIGNEGNEMLSLIPQWMKMSKEDSTGGAILNEVGNQLAFVKDAIKNITLDLLTEKYERPEYRDVDIFDIDHLYKTKIPETIDISYGIDAYKVVNGNKVIMNESPSMYQFYKEENGYIYDRESRTIYLKRIVDKDFNIEQFDALNLNGSDIASSSFDLHHVWNPLDEIGLMLGCNRIAGEVNSKYKERLFDVFRNPGNSSEIGLVNYLSRALNAAKGDIKVKTLDTEYITSLLNADGTPNDELKEYIAITNKVNDLGHQYYWSALEDNNMGLHYLPMVWNSYDYYKWEDKDIQSGIGYLDDLELTFDYHENPSQEVEYSVWAEGLQYPDREVYPEHKFKYKVMAQGMANGKGYSPEQYHYKVKAAELVQLIFDVIANARYLNKYKMEAPPTNSHEQVTRTYSDISDDKVIISRDPNNTYDTVILTDGTYCNNPGQRSLYVLANLFTKDDSKTPALSKVEIDYTATDGTNYIKKKVVLVGDSGITRPEENKAVVGFKTNSWTDQSPIIKVKQDTNDMQQTRFNQDTSKIELVPGEYYKEYTSGGDWEDGFNRFDPITQERKTMNVRLNNKGYLTLDNM